MLSLTSNLVKREWLDLIFQDRNKSYGAYWLRIRSAKIMARALLYSSVFFVLIFLTPDLIALIGLKRPKQEIIKIVNVTLQPPPPVNPKMPPPPPPPLTHLRSQTYVEPPRPRNNMIKFPPPIVKPDNQIHDEPPELKDLKNADPGQITVLGDPDADIVTIGPVGVGEKQAKVVEDTKVYQFNSLEVSPSFPGGIEKFYMYIQNALQYPEFAKANNIQGKVFLSFIVEKNGQLTDIKVDRKVGGGLDEEAIRVLKLSPRWNPGIQNGRPVRVKYNIPINFSLSISTNL